MYQKVIPTQVNVQGLWFKQSLGLRKADHRQSSLQQAPEPEGMVL